MLCVVVESYLACSTDQRRSLCSNVALHMCCTPFCLRSECPSSTAGSCETPSKVGRTSKTVLRLTTEKFLVNQASLVFMYSISCHGCLGGDCCPCMQWEWNGCAIVDGEQASSLGRCSGADAQVCLSHHQAPVAAAMPGDAAESHAAQHHARKRPCLNTVTPAVPH